MPARRHCPEPVLARSLPLGYKWSKDFMEAGKKRLAGDIVRQANTSEVTELPKTSPKRRKPVKPPWVSLIF